MLADHSSNPVAKQPRSRSRNHVRLLIPTLLICVAISSFTQLLNELGWWRNLVFALGFGVSIVICTMLSGKLFPRLSIGMVDLLGTLIGVIIGLTLLLLQLHWLYPGTAFNDTRKLWLNISLGIMFSFMVSYFFRSAYQVQESRLAFQAEKLQRLEQERHLKAAELQVLQSQMEPHFLFNTLATLQSLIDLDPVKAKQVLASLTQMLRHTLNRSRKELILVAEELELVRAYLQIQQVRMGSRLEYQLQCEPALAKQAIPPLLIQPLVENAIIHGLAPLQRGGCLEIDVEQQLQRWCIKVRDNGKGMAVGDHRCHGIALENIRQRLAMMYGDEAELQVFERSDGGVESILILPVQEQGG